MSGILGHSTKRIASSMPASFVFKNIFGENILISSITIKSTSVSKTVNDTIFKLDADLKNIDSIDFKFKNYKPFSYSYSKFKQHFPAALFQEGNNYQYVTEILPYNNSKLLNNEKFIIKRNRLLQVGRKRVFKREGSI
jgi:hypothetical protein